MALYRLAESVGCADVESLVRDLPECDLEKWRRYFDQRDMEFDKVEYYLVQISRLLGMVVGADSSDLILDRDKLGCGGSVETVERHISGEEAAQVFRVAFGV